MDVNKFCILISSLSFFAYGISYFTSPHMKKEFQRFGLEKIGLVTIILEILGAIGLIVGFWYNSIMILSSLGLALLMLVGVIVRIRLRDSIKVTLPALFYMVLNSYVFWITIN